MVVPSNLDDRQILFSNEEDDEASHTASKNAIPSCAAEWHFLDLVKVLVEMMNFMRVRYKKEKPEVMDDFGLNVWWSFQSWVQTQLPSKRIIFL